MIEMIIMLLAAYLVVGAVMFVAAFLWDGGDDWRTLVCGAGVCLIWPYYLAKMARVMRQEESRG